VIAGLDGDRSLALEVTAVVGRVLDRLYASQARAYLDVPEEERAGHIFLDIARLHRWLAQIEHGLTPQAGGNSAERTRC